MSNPPPLAARAVSLGHRLMPTDLVLAAGQLVLLVGPNGAGKTSLLHSLAGIGGMTGEVVICGHSLASMPVSVRSGLIALLAAERDVTWPLAVTDFVALGLGVRDDISVVSETLASLDLLDFASRRIDRLSTGERARVMLARALVARPKVLLLDEPAAHLDPRRQIAVLERLRLEADRGAAVLASIHDLALARQFADRVIVMADRCIIADGPPVEALAAEVVKTIFGVEWSGDIGWVQA